MGITEIVKDTFQGGVVAKSTNKIRPNTLGGSILSEMRIYGVYLRFNH